MKNICSGMALLLLAFAAAAQDRADIDTTKIIGNRELPKVLTFVPWKKPLPGVLAGRPLQSVLDESLTPIDRDVLRRQIDYGAQVQAQVQTQVQAQVQTQVGTSKTATPMPTPGAPAAVPTPESNPSARPPQATTSPPAANGEKR
jgi:hypothetical protein